MNYREELELIRQKGSGFLRPQEVVHYARNPETDLHKHFEWDDAKAGEKYRLAQARAIIRVAVLINPDSGEKIRAYVSLRDDREDGNSYRAMAEILNDEILAEKLISQAYADLMGFQNKYQRLRAATELGSVFTAIDDVLQVNHLTQPSAA